MRFSASIVALTLVSLIAMAVAPGCRSSYHGEAVVRPEFLTYDRVALWQSISREVEDYFIPMYMDAFPTQVLVERRDVSAIIGEQDILPERLDEVTRAKLRRILGVKAIVYARVSQDGFAIKVIETDTGAITASVFEDSTDIKGAIPTKTLVHKAIAALKKAADAQGGAHLPVAEAPPASQPATSPAAPLEPIHPPPHD